MLPSSKTNAMEGAPASQARFANQLRTDIIRCRWAPGTILVENQLKEDYQVSLATVRSALKELTLQGFIHSVPRVGHLVTVPTRRDAQEIFEVRMILEQWTAQRAAEIITEEQVTRLAALDYHCDVDDVESFSRSLAANRVFHLTIAQIAGNQHVVTILEGILDQVTRFLHMGLVTAAQTGGLIDDHAALLQSLADHDPERAAQTAMLQIREAFLMIDRGIVQALTSPENPVSLSLPTAHQ